MKLIHTKSNWEAAGQPLSAFLQRSKNDGFEAVEIFLPAQPMPPHEIAAMVRDAGLKLVAQINTVGTTPGEHITSLEQRYRAAVEAGPLLVNSHSGRDIFRFGDNLRIFQHGCELARVHGIPLAHETHRGRPTAFGPETRRYLEALPDLLLTADFSHWVCVHESNLADQPENLEIAIQHTLHIHARVGFAEGPQVPDPLAPEWSNWRSLHLGFWKRIIQARKAAGAGWLTITPEFGPPPYMPVEPYTKRPMADAWKINVAFSHWLRDELGSET